MTRCSASSCIDYLVCGIPEIILINENKCTHIEYPPPEVGGTRQADGGQIEGVQGTLDDDL